MIVYLPFKLLKNVTSFNLDDCHLNFVMMYILFG